MVYSFLFSVALIFRSVIGMPFCVDAALGRVITSLLSILYSEAVFRIQYHLITNPVPDQDPALFLLMELLGSGAGSGSCI
jgi:hypothetical protein